MKFFITGTPNSHAYQHFSLLSELTLKGLLKGQSLVLLKVDRSLRTTLHKCYPSSTLSPFGVEPLKANSIDKQLEKNYREFYFNLTTLSSELSVTL